MGLQIERFPLPTRPPFRRRPDVAVYDDTAQRIEEAYDVGRLCRSGRPVIRDRVKESEYVSRGIPYQLEPVIE